MSASPPKADIREVSQRQPPETASHLQGDFADARQLPTTGSVAWLFIAVVLLFVILPGVLALLGQFM
jgi:hypothetical protein